MLQCGQSFYHFIIYSSFIIAQFVYQVDSFLCGEVSTFNLLCKNGTVSYLLSASPCQDKNYISITIINSQSGNITRVLTDKDIDEPIPIIDEPGKGLIFDLHSNSASEYRKQTLHVLLNHVDIEQYKTKYLIEYNVLNHQFYMFRDECDDTVIQKFDTGFKKVNACENSLRLSEFSTVCSFESGVYLVILDPCTVPASVTVMYITEDNIVQQQFTGNKSDTFLSMTNNKQCGIQLSMVDLTEDLHHVRLHYGCNGNKTLTLLLDDTYHNEMGMICPLLECKQVSKVEQVCSQPWIIGENKNQIAHSRIKLNICADVVEANFSIFLSNGENFFPMQRYMYLKADHEEKLHEFGYAVDFLLNTKTYNQTKKVDNGYLDVAGGNVSLYVAEFPEDKVIHTVVVRHHPSFYNFLPIVHNEFNVDRKDVCKSESDKSRSDKENSMNVALPIVIVATVIFIVIVGILWWRRRQRNMSPGLPYQIHMSGNELDDEFAY